MKRNPRRCLINGHTRNHLALPPISNIVEAKGAEVRFTRSSWKDTVHTTRDCPNTSPGVALGASYAWLVCEPRRAPSRHGGHARMNCNMTKTVHDRNTPPPAPPLRAPHGSYPLHPAVLLMAMKKKSFWPTMSSMTGAILTFAIYKVMHYYRGWVCYDGDGTV